jgi:DNA-binding NtrC family response regulator/predicted hydrocarbon binding protein
MFANDLHLSELVEFLDGNITLQGRRLVLHDIHAIAELRRDLLRMLGKDQARQILTRFGYWWGKADAAALTRVFAWKSIEERLKAGPRLQTISGVAKTVIKSLNIDTEKSRFKMEIIWHDSVEVSEQLMADGPTKEASCWKLTGYASGFASYCLNREIYFIEDQCMAKGDMICSATGQDKDSWGDTILPHLNFFELDDIQSRIEKLSEELRNKTTQLEEQRRKNMKAVPSSMIHPEVRSTAYLKVLHLAERVAPYDSSLLITGETGTGKEIISRHIHSISPRSKNIFLPINCGALPEGLLESELFGHTAGAFIGANRERAGIFEDACGGTVFLDEIGVISATLQVKLLRVLQEHVIVRIGENRPRPVDVRIMAATNRDLLQLIREGTFREDLYYRLAVVEINLPPLRQRIEDIIPLARHFVKAFARKFKLPNLHFDASCLDYLQTYEWPGNIRELENAIERAAMLCTDGLIRPENLILKKSTSNIDHQNFDPDKTFSLDELEMRHIASVLQLTKGNQRKACEILGISQATLWRKMKKQAIVPAMKN